MAIFHLSAHDRVSRSAGQSSLASAAYMMRAQFTDARTGQVYDFRRLDAPQWVGMFSPKDAPDWTRDAANAERFWNALELFEKRKDAQIALPLDIALPHEMSLQQNIWLAQDYIRETFTRQGYVVLAAIHPPDHDERNIHLHLLVSLRKIDAHGFARTKAEQQENYRNRDAYIEKLREKWEQLANRHLERHGIEARIDRRTLQEQGLDRAAQKHRGPTKSAVVFLQQDRETRAAAVAEIAQLKAQIIDLDAKRAARVAREAATHRSDELTPTKDRPMDKEPAAAADAGINPDTRDKSRARDAANQNQRAPEPQRIGLSVPPGFAPETIAATSPGKIERIVETMKAEAPTPDHARFDNRETFRPTTSPEPGRYDQLKTPEPAMPEASAAPEAVAAAKADNFRVLSPDESRETVEAWAAAQQPGANQNNPEHIALAAAQQTRQTPEAAVAPSAPEPANSSTGEPPRAAEAESPDVKTGSGFARFTSQLGDVLGSIGDRLGAAIAYLSDLIVPPPAMPPEQLEDAVRRVQEAEEAARAEAYKGYVPGYDDDSAGRRDWRGLERPEPQRDFARDHDRDDDLEPD